MLQEGFAGILGTVSDTRPDGSGHDHHNPGPEHDHGQQGQPQNLPTNSRPGGPRSPQTALGRASHNMPP